MTACVCLVDNTKVYAIHAATEFVGDRSVQHGCNLNLGHSLPRHTDSSTQAVQLLME